MTYYALMWNPGVDVGWPEFVNRWRANKASKNGRISRWSCGVNQKLAVGDKAILIRTSVKPTGVVAIGTIVRGSFKEDHWNQDSPRAKADFVEVEWEVVRTEPLIGKDDANWAHLAGVWKLQSGGTKVEDADGNQIFEEVRELSFWDFVPSTEQFVSHWIAYPPKEKQRRMLVVHYWSPTEQMLPEYLGRAMGWEGMPAANLHYGRLAAQTASALDVIYPEASDSISLFASLPRDSHGRVCWQMHAQVRRAIEILEWHKEGGIVSEAVDTTQLLLLEGRQFERTVRFRERNATLREHCLSIHPWLCRACGFKPAKAGEKFAAMLEVHHSDPLSASEKERTTDPEHDCILLCPTCHRLAHHGMKVGTCRDIDTLRSLVAKLMH